MDIKCIASGSSGNCYLIKTGTTKIIIECGISIKKIRQAIDDNIAEVDACLISHSHLDHCKGVYEMIKLGIKIFTTKPTAEKLKIINYYNYIEIKPLKQFNINEIVIKPFDTEHDCEGSVGFLILDKKNNKKLVFATDTYYIKYKFNNVNYYMLECNYDEDIIKSKKIDDKLKMRIYKSHFSHKNLIEYLNKQNLKNCERIYLLHLSKDNADEKYFVKNLQKKYGIPIYYA